MAGVIDEHPNAFKTVLIPFKVVLFVGNTKLPVQALALVAAVLTKAIRPPAPEDPLEFGALAEIALLSGVPLKLPQFKLIDPPALNKFVMFPYIVCSGINSVSENFGIGIHFTVPCDIQHDHSAT